ncbi:MAG: ABC-2 transporter permease [Lachnospiraceae bacterium]|nr:ABC-2 transporter permease [Lachnospiraceae bacterium]
MNGLLLHEIYGLKRVWKSYLLVLIMFYMIDFVSFLQHKSHSSLAFGAYIGIYIAFGITFQIFNYQESVQWNTYANTMPVTKKQLVSVYYILGGIAVIVGSICSMIDLMLFHTPRFSFDMALTLSSQFATVVLGISVLIPLMIKIGYRRSIIVLILCVIAVISAMSFVIGLMISLFDRYSHLSAAPGIGLFVLAIILLLAVIVFASFQISFYLYEKKEF